MGELYPKTVQIFKYDNFMGIDQLSTSLKAAFNKDLQNLPKHLIKAIETPKTGGWFSNNLANPDLRDFFLTGANFIFNLENGKNPKESFEQLTLTNTSKVIPFIDIIKIYQKELFDDGSWVKPYDFNDEVNNIFSALLYNEYKENFKEGLTPADKKKYMNIAYSFTTSLYEFTSAINKYNSNKEESADLKSFTIQDYEEYLSVYNKLIFSAADFLIYKNIHSLSTIKGFKNGNVTDIIIEDKVVILSQEMIQNLLEMKIAGKNSNYSLHVSNTNFILTNLFDGKDKIKDATDKKLIF